MKKILLICFLLAACNKGIKGAYSGGGHEFNFKSDGTVVQSYMGKTAATYKYEAHGDEIKVFLNENTPLICHLDDKGLSIPNVPFLLTKEH